MRRLALAVAAAVLLLAGCGSGQRAHLWITHPRALTACVSSDCGPWEASLDWTIPAFPGQTGYWLFLNGTKVGSASSGPFTFRGVDCGATNTLGVEAHDGAGNHGPLWTESYTAPACSVPRQPIDGGTSYFANISANSAWLDTVIPLGGWLEQPQDATEVGYDSAMHNNIYWSLAGNASNPSDLVADYNTIRCPSNPSSSTVCSGGMHVIAPYEDANTGVETVGWQGYDESDGLGAGSGPWNTSTGCTSGSCGYTAADFYYAGNTTNVSGSTTLPFTLDGRIVSQGFTSGVLWGDTTAQDEQFMGYSDFESADNYWLTWGQQGTSQYNACAIGNTGVESSAATTACNASTGLSAAQAVLPANYGWQVKRMEELDTAAGISKPIATDVETGCPGSTYNGLGNCTDLPGIVAAVWQSLIAGARGIVYFQHNFAGPCVANRTFVDGSNSSASDYNCQIGPTNSNMPSGASAYTLHQMVQTVTAVNQEVGSLTGALLSPTAVDEVSTSGNVSVMAKAASGTSCYVFAGSGTPFDPPTTNMSVTMTLANGYSGTVTPVDGEGNALSPVTITNGTFTDTFADENAIHIYDIPAAC